MILSLYNNSDIVVVKYYYTINYNPLIFVYSIKLITILIKQITLN